LLRVGIAWVEDPVPAHLQQAIGALRKPVRGAGRGWSVEVEGMVWLRRGCGALPDRGRDDPGVDLDAARVRLVDERLERVERRRVDTELVGARRERSVAQAVAAAHDL